MRRVRELPKVRSIRVDGEDRGPRMFVVQEEAKGIRPFSPGRVACAGPLTCIAVAKMATTDAILKRSTTID
jgi:hypothetical protein